MPAKFQKNDFSKLNYYTENLKPQKANSVDTEKVAYNGTQDFLNMELAF